MNNTFDFASFDFASFDYAQEAAEGRLLSKAETNGFETTVRKNTFQHSISLPSTPLRQRRVGLSCVRDAEGVKP